LEDKDMIDYGMLPECCVFLEYYRGLLYEGTMAKWWVSYCLGGRGQPLGKIFWHRVTPCL
ncbi:MAG: hypothetical protein QGG73_13190, partial [Candidatus Hydrogenedentes bacterium]|nr:hypothetical protein [Candidatus Hydrogenedentota bacterium]